MVDKSAPKPDELIELAAVMRAHGLRGELLLKPFNPDSTLLAQMTRVLLKTRDGTVTSYELDEARTHSGMQLLALHGVRTRDAAEALRGSLVCVTRADLPALEDDEFYLVDLVGLAALDTQGNPAGSVVDVVEYPSVNCLVVESEAGRREVPNLPRYVLSIDMTARIVVVDQLEELELETPKG
jgi:16S rRNA processing protein RimM